MHDAVEVTPELLRSHADALRALARRLLHDDDAVEEDDEGDDDSPVSDADYVAWLAGQTSSTDLEDDVEEVVMDELVDAFTSALGSLFTFTSRVPRSC